MCKKKIAVIITDTHLGDDNSFQVIDIFKQAINVVKSNDLKELYHLGDHFTNRASQRLNTLLTLKEISRLLVESEINLITIAGNHDKTSQSVSQSYLDLYNTVNFTVYEGNYNPIRITEDTDIHMLPFYSDSEFSEKLEEIKYSMNSSKKNLLFTHFGLDGVLNNDGFKVEADIGSLSFRPFDLTLMPYVQPL